MIERSTLAFLRALKRNNNRDWFQDNKSRYQASKANFEMLINSLIFRMAEFEPRLHGLDAREAMFRIYRDVRFSEDKSPYKSHFGAYLAPGGRRSSHAGYYFHLEAGGKSYIAGGMYRPDAAALRAIRSDVDHDPEGFQRIFQQRSFRTYFSGLQDMADKLKTAPKGFSRDHPQIEILRNKSFVVVHGVTDKQLLERGFERYVLKGFQAMKPLIDRLNRATGLHDNWVMDQAASEVV